MTRSRAATIFLSLLAALIWAPLALARDGGSTSQVVDPAASPGPAASLAPAPATQPSPVVSPALAPAATPPRTTATASHLAAAPSALGISLAYTPAAPRPLRTVTGTGPTARPTAATVKSARPKGSTAARAPAPSRPDETGAEAGGSSPSDMPAAWTWVVALLTAFVVLASMLLLFGGRSRTDDRPITADGGHPSPVAQRSGSASVLPSPSPSSRLEPADDPILSAMGLDPSAPASKGARAVRAHRRRVMRGRSAQPGSGKARPAENERLD